MTDKPSKKASKKKESYSKEVKKQEDNISHLVVDILRVEAQLDKLKKESFDLMRQLFQEATKENRASLVKRITNLRDAQTNELTKYIRLCRQKDDMVCELRVTYAAWIEQESGGGEKIFGSGSKEAVAHSISLKSTSLYSVTTLGNAMLIQALQKAPVRYDCLDVPDSFPGKGKYLDMDVWTQQYPLKDTNTLISKFTYLKNLTYHPHLVSFIGYIPPSKPDDKKQVPLPLLLTEYADNMVPCLHKAITSVPIYELGFHIRVRVALEILHAMAWLHDVNKLVHLRLKPSNILFFTHGRESWRCKVADYDLGFLREDSNTNPFSHIQYYAPEMFSDSFSVSSDNDKKAADVWAYGMLLYTLFSYKEPFPNGADAKKIQNVNEDELSKLFDSLNSKALKIILMDCCKRAPNDRFTFRKIIDKYEKSQFPQILKELDLTEILIQTIWEKASKLSKLTTKDNIEFKVFYDYLIKYFKLQKKPEEAHYLKEALRLPYLLKLGEQDPNLMTRENFGVLARLFKFTKKKDETFIARIVEVFKADWFYGVVDRMEAQKQLEALAARKKDNYIYFIVRFANSRQFCFTFKKDANWENSNIDPAQVLKDGGYAKYVTQFSLKILRHELIPALQKTFPKYDPKKK